MVIDENTMVCGAVLCAAFRFIAETSSIAVFYKNNELFCKIVIIDIDRQPCVTDH